MEEGRGGGWKRRRREEDVGRGGRREDEVMKVVRKRRAVQQQPWPCSSFRLEPFLVLALACLARHRHVLRARDFQGGTFDGGARQVRGAASSDCTSPKPNQPVNQDRFCDLDPSISFLVEKRRSYQI